MDAVNNLPLMAAFVACQQLLAAVMIIFDDISTRYTTDYFLHSNG
jgi:hypothetical protein